ncbi:MAG: enoyl-CoA hydratase/isomerase family protein [Caulobacteraceae bacterium]|nr:enoyl-CoA hydratase/isomerase family protein [Caulobacteraceae bacterium]
MSYQAVRYETRGDVAILTLNVPDRLNAIGRQLREDVIAAVAEAHADDAVRALILTGEGRGFCSGADLSGARPAGPAEGVSQNARLDEEHWVGRWAKMWAGFDKPLIGAINGVAAGAGMSTALACDVRIGSEHARFKTVFLERSLSPDSGMSYFLPRIVGYARAADLIFTSRAVDAEEAYRLGLLDRLVKHETLLDEALAYARQMTRWPPLALRSAKRVLQHGFEADLDQALFYELMGLDVARRSPNDVKESGLAFREKRPGVFTGT